MILACLPCREHGHRNPGCCEVEVIGAGRLGDLERSVLVVVVADHQQGRVGLWIEVHGRELRARGRHEARVRSVSARRQGAGCIAVVELPIGVGVFRRGGEDHGRRLRSAFVVLGDSHPHAGEDAALIEERPLLARLGIVDERVVPEQREIAGDGPVPAPAGGEAALCELVLVAEPAPPHLPGVRNQARRATG